MAKPVDVYKYWLWNEGKDSQLQLPPQLYQTASDRPTTVVIEQKPAQLSVYILNQPLQAHLSNTVMMHFTTATIATVAFTAFAIASPVELAPRQNATLEPWQLSGISGFSPSGRPGSYPWLNIVANLVDPNELTLGTSTDDGSEVTVPAGNAGANCTAKWYTGTKPFNHIWPCDPTGDGYWYMEIEETSDFSTANFDVKFTRVADVIYHGSEFKKTYTGSAHFEVGDNMSGTCGGSGVCSWGLKAELSPYAIQQTEVPAA
ncbi:hypothetical protein K491DRAFT_689322 [Lophiostoma macrostomum CBS 122681]|uniref:Cell death in tomato 1 n=1 Tax=Lophiostoma macrostomum CBS 122681 TaxID=1314788 RepID=A0A6A6THG1_9PLEO|nr:hypothetical protein K491DRAFT_689322 [Lophiostoma macrostomum CBS 122681]